MKVKLLFSVVLFYTLSLTSARNEETTPPQVKVLLTKLVDWESNEKTELDKKIQSKRNDVIVVLQKYLQGATKRGDLKTANLIQHEIKRLTPPPVPVTAKLLSKMRTDEEIKELIIGKKWKLRGDAYIVMMVFESGGEGKRLDVKGDEFSNTWRIENNTLQLLWLPQKTWVDVTINNKGNEFSCPNEPGGKIVRYRK